MKKISSTFNTLICSWLFCLAVNAGDYNQAISYLHPIPDSRYHKIETTIILKLDTAYIKQITDLDSLISITGKKGDYSGIVLMAADERTIIFKPGSELLYDDTITVSIKTSQFIAEDFNYTFYTRGSEFNIVKNEIPVNKSLSESPGMSETFSELQIINGMTVPDDFPEITTNVYGETAPGLIFYADHGRYLHIFDNEGRPYYYLRGGIWGNMTVQPTGHLTFYEYNMFYIVMDSTFTIIDTIQCGHGYPTDSHELTMDENGHAFLLPEESLRFYKIDSETGDTSRYRITGNHVQELDNDRNVIFEWRCWDHVDYSVFTTVFNHINSIAIDYDDHFLISSRELNEIAKINRNTGEYIWRLGGYFNDFTYINETNDFGMQHDARPVPGKPNHYTIFDNGHSTVDTIDFNRDSNNSRVVEYKIDTNAMTAEKVWEYYYHENLWGMGSAQRLSNGNTFIDWTRTRAEEVDATGNKVFDFVANPSPGNYRCRRYNWYGKMIRPHMYYEDLGIATRLIYNQFGDTTVSYYKIYGGLDKNNLSLIDSTPVTNYTLTDLPNYSHYSFGVSSVNNEGKESKLSDIQERYIQYKGPMQNLIIYGDFTSSAYWSLSMNSPAQANRKLDDKKYKIVISEPGNNLEDISLSQKPILLLKGKTYVLEFEAYATKDRVIEAKLRKAESPFTNYSKNGKSYLTTIPQHFTYQFTMTESTDQEAVLTFNAGQYDGDVIIDNVSLKYLEEGIDPELIAFANINFQKPDEFTLGSAYKIDTGGIYEMRYNEFVFGWDRENMNSTSRDSSVDQRLKSFNHLKKATEEYTWEIEIPETDVAVKIGLGDAGSTTQINQVYVEDLLINDPDGEDHFDEIIVSGIRVTDGKLTIKPGPQARDAKICYIDIYYDKKQVPNAIQLPKAKPELSVYPVPASDNIVVSFTQLQTGKAVIELFDMTGRKVDHLTSQISLPGEQRLMFNTSHLPPSVYFIRCLINGNILSGKIIIQ